MKSIRTHWLIVFILVACWPIYLILPLLQPPMTLDEGINLIPPLLCLIIPDVILSSLVYYFACKKRGAKFLFLVLIPSFMFMVGLSLELLGLWSAWTMSGSILKTQEGKWICGGILSIITWWNIASCTLWIANIKYQRSKHLSAITIGKKLASR